MWLLSMALAADPEAPPGKDRPVIEDCAVWGGAALSRRLDRRTDSTEVLGNQVELLVDGAEAFGRRRENVAAADLVLVKTFLWNDDAVGREMALLLADRARAGALVVVQYDYKANAPLSAAVGKWVLNTREAPPPPSVLLPVIAAGGLVVPTNVPNRRREIRRVVARSDGTGTNGTAAAAERNRARGGIREFDHEKYWITGYDRGGVVELRAILGGLNVGSEYAYGGTLYVDPATGRGGWRDTDVEVRGPLTTTLAARFYDVLALNATSLPETLDRSRWVVEQPAAGDAAVRFVWAQPQIGRRHHVDHLYRALIRATPVDAPLVLETAYFAPPPATFRALREAVEDGARVSVVTNSAESVDVPFIADASGAAYNALVRAGPGVTLHHWRVRPGAETLHSKVASFGACGPVIVGSANLDGLSTEHNSEAVVLVRDSALRAAFDVMIAGDLASAEPFTLDDANDIAWAVRAWQSFVYAVGWYWL